MTALMWAVFAPRAASSISSSSNRFSCTGGTSGCTTQMARLLGVAVAAGSKQRLADDRVVIDRIVGDVVGRDVIVDDEIATAGSIIELLRRLRSERVGEISLACTHGLFTGPAIERLKQEPDIAEIVTTNTVPLPPEKQLPNNRGSLGGAAVRRGRPADQSRRVGQQSVSSEETYG